MSSSNKDKVKTVDTEVKVEKHIIGICEFEGTVLNNSHSSKLISVLTIDLTYRILIKNLTSAI